MDPSWCPGCDRLILPKRYIVPVQPQPPPTITPHTPPATTDPPSPDENDPKPPPPPPAPTPVPSSPEVRKKLCLDPTRTRRPYGGGLLQGTGRVRPGGGLRLRPAPTQAKKHTPTPPQAAPALPAPDAPILLGNPTAARIGTVHPPLNPPPVVTPAPAPALPPTRKTRVVISQEPTPLYCSDECRLRDLKNSFIESESAGFAGASCARDRISQLELVKQTVQRNSQPRDRRASAAIQPSTLGDGFLLPILSPVQREAAESDHEPEPTVPPVPPNSLVDPQPPSFSTGSITSSSGSSSERLRGSASKNSTIRPVAPRSRPALPSRSSSFSTWGSPTKAALAPPARSLFNAAPVAGPSSSWHSISSSTSSSSASALFDDHMFSVPDADGAETCGTTPSRRGSDSSADSDQKKQKRVSFAGDAKPGDQTLGDQVVLGGSHEHIPSSSPTREEELRLLRGRRRIPHFDANFLRDAVSVSPKDRVKASSLPSYGTSDTAGDVTTSLDGLTTTTTGSGAPASRSTSTPMLCGSVVAEPPVRRTQYKVPMMWPEDEKRTTESARVHGELLRGYAKRFGPREGRSFVWGTLWAGHDADAAGRRGGLSAEVKRAQQIHDEEPDSSKEYWRAFEKREAEARARRKAEEAVQRLEEERVICELLQGKGMAEQDQPQARRMRRMAYDGMPGPAELRGLTYKFDRFLYPLVPPKPTLVEKKVRKWDEGRGEWVDEVMQEEVFEERKKLFNFSED